MYEGAQPMPVAAADPFAGALLPALEPYLSPLVIICLLRFILQKGFELSFGGK